MRDSKASQRPQEGKAGFFLYLGLKLLAQRYQTSSAQEAHKHERGCKQGTGVTGRIV